MKRLTIRDMPHVTHYGVGGIGKRYVCPYCQLVLFPVRGNAWRATSVALRQLNEHIAERHKEERDGNPD